MTETHQESHTPKTDLLNTKTLNNMNHTCLKGTMEKVDSGETLVKPNNFNHINEVRSDACEAIPFRLLQTVIAVSEKAAKPVPLQPGS